MRTVLYSLQRMSRRDARQPRPPWSSLTLRRRTSDERAASRARVSESWRLSALRCRRRGVEMWAPLRWVRAVSRAGLRPRTAPHVVDVRPRYLGQSSGVGTSDPRPSATEGTSSRRRAESLQAGSSASVSLLPDHCGEVAKSEAGARRRSSRLSPLVGPGRIPSGYPIRPARPVERFGIRGTIPLSRDASF